MNRQCWFSEDNGVWAIWLWSRAQSFLTQQGKGNFHIWLTCRQTIYIKCNLSPNDSDVVFAAKLAFIKERIHRVSGNVILSRDFNATTNRREQILLEMATRWKLVVQIRSNKPTYHRPGVVLLDPQYTFCHRRCVSEDRHLDGEGWLHKTWS